MNSVGISVNLTVPSHVTCAPADAADDVGRKVTLLRAVILAVANTTTILAYLVFVITERTVERSKFTKLVAFMVILTFGGGCSLYVILAESESETIQMVAYRFDDLVDQFDTSSDFVV